MKKFLLVILYLLLSALISGCAGNTIKASSLQTRTKIIDGQNPGENLTDFADLQTSCSTLDPHPMAESIAEKFEIEYLEVMTLYCDGHAFSDILVALETEELVDRSAEELLSLLETRSWEQIWDDLGVSPR